MLQPRTPDDEATRLASLRELLILDTPPEDRFDIITTYAASRFDVMVAVVALMDADNNFIKSLSCTIGEVDTSRKVSFCGHAILQNDVFEIPDASQDARFVDNPLVTEPPRIRFYAGQPLTMPNGQNVGTLCLFDSRPRRLSESEREQLRGLAKLVVSELLGVSASAEFQKIAART